MWSAPDPTSTMMARPLPESPVGRGEPGGAGPPGQRAASVLVSNSLHAWERCTCQAGKSFAVVSAQPTASRSCGGVTRAHGQALAAPGSAPASSATVWTAPTPPDDEDVVMALALGPASWSCAVAGLPVRVVLPLLHSDTGPVGAG
jgi:hypothetical protein